MLFFCTCVIYGYMKITFIVRGYGLPGTIDNLWIKNALCFDLVGIIRQQAAIIATAIASMARRTAVLYNLDQEAGLFAIHKDTQYLLRVTRLFTLAPDSIP